MKCSSPQKQPKHKKLELTADEMELLTSPMELTKYKDAMYCGTKRNVESELSSKNTQVG